MVFTRHFGVKNDPQKPCRSDSQDNASEDPQREESREGSTPSEDQPLRLLRREILSL